MLSSRIE